MGKNISTQTGLVIVIILAATSVGGIVASQYSWQTNQSPVYTPTATAAPTTISNPTPTPVACTPKWKCDWGPCKSGYQSLVLADSNNCGLSSAGVNIACAALARACAQ